MMRRKLPLLLGAAVLALATGACEGPRGPAGPAGPDGPQGPDGLDGALCTDCHTADPTLLSIEALFSSSAHGPDNYELLGPRYAGGACVSCHTSQGFSAAVTETTPDFSQGAAPMSCRTCHQIHSDERGGSLALATTEPLTLRIGETTVDLGKGNLCANCHQGRMPDLMPTVGEGGQDTIPSSHFGTHHGPQANVMAAGPGLPVFPGAETVPTEPFSFHITLDGTEKVACVGCHMQSTVGTGLEAGGHTWSMIYDGTEVLNDGTCDACHVDVTTAYDDITAVVEPLLDDIGACLLAEGVVDSAGSPVSGAVVDNDLIAAFLVWQTMTEDGSHGAHHPTYVPAILKNTSAYLDANYAACAP